jgi:phosphate transport system substrate-binding protein
MNWKHIGVTLRNGMGLLLVAVLVNGCGNNSAESSLDTMDSGTIHISVDESFRPVVDSQIQVFESSHPGAKIIVHYKPEADCLRDFLVDSIRLVIATRGFSPNEEAVMSDSLKVDPSKRVMAYDAVAVIVHPQSPDSMFTMPEIKDLLTGRGSKDKTPVFDGLKATSTVRFVLDSVLRGDSLSPRTVAAESSEGVIDYVARTPNAVGFIGISWIGNRDDSSQLTFLQKVKVAHLESADRPGGYVQPVQANIYYRRYPMVRDLVYILKEKHRGLGRGFANFMLSERGQLIFRRAYLMPAFLRFTLRDANLTE